MPNPRGRLAKLGTTGKFIVSRLRAPRRLHASLPLSAAVSALPASLQRSARVLTLAAGSDGLDTGIEVTAGDMVTLIGSGQIWMSKPLGLGCSTKVALWYRIGAAGRVAKSIDDSTMFIAESAAACSW
jgi:hypothetical protein